MPEDSIKTSRPVNLVLMYGDDLPDAVQVYYVKIVNQYNGGCSRTSNRIYCSMIIEDSEIP
jgi:hypothetical protein